MILTSFIANPNLHVEVFQYFCCEISCSLLDFSWLWMRWILWEAFMMQLDSSSDEILHWLFEFLLLMTWVQELGDAVRENAPAAQKKAVVNDSNLSDYIGNPLCFRVIIFSMSKPPLVLLCAQLGLDKDVAMTGEVTLTVRVVLLIGGVCLLLSIHGFFFLSLVLFGVYNLFFPPFACSAWSVCTLFQV